MTYEFKCDKCNSTKEVTASIQVGPPKVLLCETCGEQMHQDYSHVGINIPGYMRAGEGDNHRNIVHMMKHGKRPSGKSKVYY